MSTLDVCLQLIWWWWVFGGRPGQIVNASSRNMNIDTENWNIFLFFYWTELNFFRSKINFLWFFFNCYVWTFWLKWRIFHNSALSPKIYMFGGKACLIKKMNLKYEYPANQKFAQTENLYSIMHFECNSECN